MIENHIPYIKGVFDPVCKVEYFPADQITHEAVADADALIVRTRTKCNRALLDGSNVRIVATATIGTDHIDLDYCCENGIEVVNVAGCNAPAVAQYVLSSVLRLKGGDVNGLTLGIVGVG
ncbi:MAG: 4-phosphoerythronate dehydrogenase, partial [Muribaculaceae bacterium]|nr:4-phosphoerythronate dehydrogenase [Muribaculaceae bacterium]